MREREKDAYEHVKCLERRMPHALVGVAECTRYGLHCLAPSLPPSLPVRRRMQHGERLYRCAPHLCIGVLQQRKHWQGAYAALACTTNPQNSLH